ncbi:Transmembrane protein 62 [Gracilariopsis chorda]|uniref:Transmembrane protein 62 n=1 Tax=Gracilariopsis chorda TaxID=448386 RepID=A0A2V3ISQ4_9FLOR|nr:Transmembrane protein 62 [Gracilariopsis chorda]|eukprot:PXF45153.1 Transmembrane protein 62 [Gracilariopsis chorda]
MTATTAHRPDSILARNDIRSALILSVPYAFYLVLFVILLLIHGGHRHAFLFSNPYCAIPSPPFDDRPPHLVLHISDLHVNDIDGGRAKRNLHEFASNSLPKWDKHAAAILVTGDLVNSIIKQPYPLGKRSKQIDAEWQWLHSYVSAINKSVIWKAVPGNHDTFGGFKSFHPETSCATPFFRNTSHSVGELLIPSELSLNGRFLKLLGVDATLQKPLHRPLNFFGDAEAASTDLRSRIFNADGMGDVLVYGHYPSSIMEKGEGIHSAALADGGQGLKKPRFAAYLSGHLHTLLGAAKNGLQAVSASGSLELQLPDMVQSRRYRVLVFDSGYLSFKDFRLGTDNGLERIIVTNPPRAGLCSAGAGDAALKSSHVRLLSVGYNLVENGASLEINGENIGPVRKLGCAESPLDHSSDALCDHVYGARWDPYKYSRGVHELSIRSTNETFAPYMFSLDGSSEASLSSRLEQLVGAEFALSNFPAIARVLVIIGFTFSFLLCLRGCQKQSLVSISLAAISVIMCTGPALFVRNIVLGEPGWTFVGVHFMYMPTGMYKAGIDPSYLLSTSVVWGTLVPVCYLDAILSRASGPTISRRILLVFSFVYSYKGISWTLNVWGAHGFLESLFSPSCIPLTAISLIALRKALV